MQLNSPAPTDPGPQTTDFQWWRLPADFRPSEPFHPDLTIVPGGKIARRAARLHVTGQREAALDLVHAMLRALNYPLPVPREKIQLEAVEFHGEVKCNCAECQAKRAAAATAGE